MQLSTGQNKKAGTGSLSVDPFINRREGERRRLMGKQKMQGKTPEELVHELQARQVELERQNEELKKAQLDLIASAEKYIDLYDFAPVGYFTFTSEDLIVDVNLTGAAFLGVERQQLINCSFKRFVVPRALYRWDRHIASVFQRREMQSCDLLLKRQDGSTVHARLDSVAFRFN